MARILSRFASLTDEILLSGDSVHNRAQEREILTVFSCLSPLFFVKCRRRPTVLNSLLTLENHLALEYRDLEPDAARHSDGLLPSALVSEGAFSPPCAHVAVFNEVPVIPPISDLCEYIERTDLREKKVCVHCSEALEVRDQMASARVAIAGVDGLQCLVQPLEVFE